jgi:hypothetical protein
MKIPSKFIIVKPVNNLSRRSLTQFRTIKGDIYYICSKEDHDESFAFKSLLHSKIKPSNKNVIYWMSVSDMIKLHNEQKITIIEYKTLNEVQNEF